MNDSILRPRCGCKTCRANRALQGARAALNDLDNAIESFVEEGGETEMALYWLRDELAEVLRSPRSIGVRRRLRKALAVVETS